MQSDLKKQSFVNPTSQLRRNMRQWTSTMGRD